MSDFLVGFLIALLVLGVVGIAAYFVLRRIFERTSNRVADHIGDLVGRVAARAASTPMGQRGYASARNAAGHLTYMSAYAKAEGLSEDEARRQFSDSIERTARVMDAAFKLPVIGPVGLDSLLGLFPVVGDVVSAGVSVSLIARSLRYGIPPEIIAKMLANVMIDMVLGTVPVAGDVADMWFRANMRNVALLREYLARDAANTIEVTPIRSAQ